MVDVNLLEDKAKLLTVTVSLEIGYSSLGEEQVENYVLKAVTEKS